MSTKINHNKKTPQKDLYSCELDSPLEKQNTQNDVIKQKAMNSSKRVDQLSYNDVYAAYKDQIKQSSYDSVRETHFRMNQIKQVEHTSAQNREQNLGIQNKLAQQENAKRHSSSNKLLDLEKYQRLQSIQIKNDLTHSKTTNNRNQINNSLPSNIASLENIGLFQANQHQKLKIKCGQNHTQNRPSMGNFSIQNGTNYQITSDSLYKKRGYFVPTDYHQSYNNIDPPVKENNKTLVCQENPQKQRIKVQIHHPLHKKTIQFPQQNLRQSYAECQCDFDLFSKVFGNNKINKPTVQKQKYERRKIFVDRKTDDHIGENKDSQFDEHLHSLQQKIKGLQISNKQKQIEPNNYIIAYNEPNQKPKPTQFFQIIVQPSTEASNQIIDKKKYPFSK